VDWTYSEFIKERKMRIKIVGILLSIFLVNSIAHAQAGPVTPINQGGKWALPVVQLDSSGSQTSETNPQYVRQVNSLSAYASAVSNGTSDVALVAADASNYIEVASILVTNLSTTNGSAVKVCDGACSTSNWIMIPAPSAQLASNTSGGLFAFPSGFAFRTTAKNHAINYTLNDAGPTTSITVSITYRKVAN
jgi:hypothetical protein